MNINAQFMSADLFRIVPTSVLEGFLGVSEPLRLRIAEIQIEICNIRIQIMRNHVERERLAMGREANDARFAAMLREQ